MRAHGVANFPDPTVSGGRPEFVISSSSGIDTHSPQLLAKAHQCLYLLPNAQLPSVSETP